MNNKTVKVFAPASVANVGCGFDILGFSMPSAGDTIEVSFIKEKRVIISEINGCNNLSKKPEENICGLVAKAMLEQSKCQYGINIKLTKGISPGSGIGSSAASASGTAYAVNELMDRIYDENEMISFAMIGEEYASGGFHADNVAPSLLGGFVLIRGYNPLDLIKIPSPKDLYCTVILPKIEIKTKEARGLLSQEISLKSAITQWGNVGGLIAGLYTSDYNLISNSVKDVVAEPVRKKLIPHYEELKSELLSNGILACNISGSGPAIFALSKGENSSKKAEDIMRKIFDKTDIEYKIFRSKIENRGVRLIESD